LDREVLGKVALVMVAFVATITAYAHMFCIVLGVDCYRAQMAPDSNVKSAIHGTWFAPLGTAFISVLFLVCAAFVLSAAKTIKHFRIQMLPLLPFRFCVYYTG